jgi:hypothetical protein
MTTQSIHEELALHQHFASLPIQLLAGVPQLLQQHRLSGQQHDNLCGPYWAAILLQAKGINAEPSELASTAGTVLPIGEPQQWVPAGTNSRQDYAVSLPCTDRLDEAGTSVPGLIAATTLASEANYLFVPLHTQWSPERVEAMIELCQSHPDWQAVPIANIRTGHLWGSNLQVEDAIAYLSGESITIPAADWDVGHFVMLAGWVKGSQQNLILVGDTYPKLGWEGYYLQSPEAIAAALNRDDGTEGGILLFVRAGDRAAVEQAAQTQGFTITAWDNGSLVVP